MSKNVAKVMLTEEQIEPFNEFAENHEDILSAVANSGARLGFDVGYNRAVFVSGLALLAASGIMVLIDKIKK